MRSIIPSANSHVITISVLVSLLVYPVAGLRAERSRVLLSENWWIRQLNDTRPDIRELTREIAAATNDWLAVRQMPAQVHDILLDHGMISDPRIGKNAADCTWVSEKDWAYACRFPSPHHHDGPLFLCFDGLDTLATAYLNGQPVGTFDNMYRRYSVDIRDKLSRTDDSNVLVIVFSSVPRFLKQLDVPEHFEGVSKFHFLRKCHSDFGSYLGARPDSIKVGVFREVFLDIPDRSWVQDVWVRPQLSRDFGHARVHIQLELAGPATSLEMTLQAPDGEPIATVNFSDVAGTVESVLDVDTPQLWWPRTHGEQPLYKLEVNLQHQNRQLETRSVSFGIRDVRPVLLDADTGEKRFRFDVNGQPIFLRGADLAPLEGSTHCWNDERAMRLLELMEYGRMNVLRIWGEGNVPPQSFYDECDRRGILVWQDFMFGYGMHPSGDEQFDQNCQQEVESMIRSLRNHPCVLLWVGGNENHMGWDFRYGTRPIVGNRLFESIMPQAVGQLDPDRLFHSSSPFGGRVPNWPLEGDWHDYTTLKFCPHASVPLYASEVGRVSAPSLNSMRRFLRDEEIWPQAHDASITTPGKAAWPPMWQYRSVDGSWDKVGPIEDYCDPVSAEDLIRVLGTAHGDYLRDRVERQRRGTPDGQPDGNRRCWGNMVWRLNDSWPIIYWSIIDYYLEPKIAYYYLRRSYDPILVSFEQTRDEIFVWVVNDSPVTVSGDLTVKRRTFQGDTLGERTERVDVAPGEAKRCFSTTELGPIVKRREFLQAEYAQRVISQLLSAERYLHLPAAGLSAQWEDGKISVSSRAFARQVNFVAEGATGAVFEDNFFDLAPGQTREIRMLHSADAEQIIVDSLNSDPIVLQIR